MKVGSLFSGIGGMDLGLEQAGMQVIWQSETDPFASKILQKHWPHIPNLGDISLINPTLLLPVDLLCGGFPCTQTSLAAAIHGKRSGLEGDESGLWWEMFRIMQHLLPRWVLVENTGGVSRWAGEIQRCLEGCGYTVSIQTLTAHSIGAPHERRRMFFIANRDGKRLEVTREVGPSKDTENPWASSPRGAWGKNQSRTSRMDDGIPNRMDRIKCCGRAVVPKVAYEIGRAIIEADKGVI